jgi:hypothetical protein
MVESSVHRENPTIDHFIMWRPQTASRCSTRMAKLDATFDDEVLVGGRFFEAPGGVDRMNYRQAKSPA